MLRICVVIGLLALTGCYSTGGKGCTNGGTVAGGKLQPDEIKVFTTGVLEAKGVHTLNKGDSIISLLDKFNGKLMGTCRCLITRGSGDDKNVYIVDIDNILKGEAADHILINNDYITFLHDNCGFAGDFTDVEEKAKKIKEYLKAKKN